MFIYTDIFNNVIGQIESIHNIMKKVDGCTEEGTHTLTFSGGFIKMTYTIATILSHILFFRPLSTFTENIVGHYSQNFRQKP